MSKPRRVLPGSEQDIHRFPQWLVDELASARDAEADIERLRAERGRLVVALRDAVCRAGVVPDSAVEFWPEIV